MRTKHLILSLIAFMAIFLASCSEQQPMMGTEVNGTQTFTFSLTTDGQAQTRAAAPVVTGYKLKYFLQVLDADGATMTGSSTNNDTGTFNVSLPVGAAYTCLFWAHYIPESSGDNEFFNTGDLKAVTLKQHLTGADHCQAFSGTASIVADQAAGSNQTVLLKRAVAQVNIKTDTNMEGYSKLTASYTDVPNTFNVQANTVAATGSITTPSAFEVTTFPADAGADGKFTYQSAYFLASADGVGSMLKLEINTYNSVSNTPIQTLTIANVPTKKNYKTNVVASFDPASLAHTYAFDFEEWGVDPATVWDGTTPQVNKDYAFSGGDGEEQTPYLISTAADLAQLAANVNADQYSENGNQYSGKYFRQTADLDLNNWQWIVIGSDNLSFEGNYDGDHKQIKNLWIDRDDLSSVGLFSRVYGSATEAIENLHVSGMVKNRKTTSSRLDICAGGIVGFASNMKSSNCSFSGSITCENGYAGGIIGYTIAYFLYGCKNTGIIEGKYAGGIAGYMKQGPLCIDNCYNAGTVDGTEEASGIAACAEQGDIRYCYNIGNVMCNIPEKCGAIVRPNDALTVTGCYYKTAHSVVNSGETIFGENTWPTENSTAWEINTIGSEPITNGYWKSLGGWNNGTPVYPKLWWED